MNKTPLTIDEALLDVRKAYRLLHDYQRMALDAVGYIGKQLGLTYSGGWPQFSDPAPRPGKGGLDFWAWDWLNMMFYEFHFTGDLKDGDVMHLSVLLISDSGYFCSEHEEVEATEVSDFLVPERSTTAIGFVLSRENWPDTGYLHSKSAMREFIETGGSLPAEVTAQGAIGKCCNFSRIASEEDTDVLLDELVLVANAKRIPIERVGKVG